MKSSEFLAKLAIERGIEFSQLTVYCALAQKLTEAISALPVEPAHRAYLFSLHNQLSSGLLGMMTGTLNLDAKAVGDCGHSVKVLLDQECAELAEQARRRENGNDKHNN